MAAVEHALRRLFLFTHHPLPNHSRRRTLASRGNRRRNSGLQRRAARALPAGFLVLAAAGFLALVTAAFLVLAATGFLVLAAAGFLALAETGFLVLAATGFLVLAAAGFLVLAAAGFLALATASTGAGNSGLGGF
jgi:hypothetical protein